MGDLFISTRFSTAAFRRRRDRLRRLIGSTAVVVAAVGLSPAVALANVPSGSSNQAKGPGLSHASATWNEAPDTLYSLQVVGYPTFASNWCLDGIYDWKTSGGHFDARLVRSCNPSVDYSRSSNDGGQGRVLLGMQKFGTCYGPRNSTNTSSSNCSSDPRNENSILRTGTGTEDVSGPNTSLPNNCTKSWRVEPGTSSVIAHSGGASSSCSS